MDQAARDGNLAEIQRLRASGIPWSLWMCKWALLNGHLNVLQWVRANGCPWDKTTCDDAARCGHLTILQWARANGCPWDKAACLDGYLPGPVRAWIMSGAGDRCCMTKSSAPRACTNKSR